MGAWGFFSFVGYGIACGLFLLSFHMLAFGIGVLGLMHMVDRKIPGQINSNDIIILECRPPRFERFNIALCFSPLFFMFSNSLIGEHTHTSSTSDVTSQTGNLCVLVDYCT
jgi:hypothetical protein